MLYLNVHAWVYSALLESVVSYHVHHCFDVFFKYPVSAITVHAALLSCSLCCIVVCVGPFYIYSIALPHVQPHDAYTFSRESVLPRARTAADIKEKIDYNKVRVVVSIKVPICYIATWFNTNKQFLLPERAITRGEDHKSLQRSSITSVEFTRHCHCEKPPGAAQSRRVYRAFVWMWNAAVDVTRRQ